jgi:hypothetical protein
VAAQIIGNQLGLCVSCTLILATSEYPNTKIPNYHIYPKEVVIVQLLDALDDIKKKNRQGKATISMSFSVQLGSATTNLLKIMLRTFIPNG